MRRFGGVVVAGLIVVAADGCTRGPKAPPRPPGSTTLLSYSNIEQAWQLGRGAGMTVAIMDWQFDDRESARRLYLHPTTLIPGEEIGDLERWHGAWMVDIVHAVAPDASIMPIIARSTTKRSFPDLVPAGIRYAADHGAAVVTSSMGPMVHGQALREAVEYALARGCIFVNVHPEVVVEAGAEPRPCRPGECLDAIVRTGVVAVPSHPAAPDPARDVYTWPYDLAAEYMDGWGYSNAPPTVAGVIALMRSANPALPVATVKRLLIETAAMRDGFRVVDADAAVRAATR